MKQSSKDLDALLNPDLSFEHQIMKLVQSLKLKVLQKVVFALLKIKKNIVDSSVTGSV